MGDRTAKIMVAAAVLASVSFLSNCDLISSKYLEICLLINWTFFRGNMSSVGSYESSGEDFSEDYEVLNQESFSNTSIDFEDIKEAILGVKGTILETEVSSQARKDLVHKLIRWSEYF